MAAFLVHSRGSLLLFILYGGFEVLYGLYSGYSPLTALQNLVFNIYPVYFFCGCG